MHLQAMNDVVRLSANGWGFVAGPESRAVVPWGCNYYDPFTGWPPQLWSQFDAARVADHFDAMRSIGVNVVRVFTTLAATLEEEGAASPSCRPNKAGIAKIERMLEIAWARGIRVILSGPSSWEGTPRWWHAQVPLDCYARPELIAAQGMAWHGIASALRGSPALFSYELHNEPCAPFQATPVVRELWARWRRSEADPRLPEDFPAPRDPLRLDWSWALQRFREEIASRYVLAMVEAIKECDDTHLVTMGLHQKSAPFDWYPPDPYAAFNPHALIRYLDYTSVHFYPHHVFHPNIYRDPFESDAGMAETLCHARAVSRYVHAGERPVLMEECGWYGGGPVFFADREQRALSEAQQTEWCTRLVQATRGDVCGWLFWPYRDTPSSLDPSRRSGLFDENGGQKDWGRAFARLAPEITTAAPARQAATIRLPAPLQRLTTEPEFVKSFRSQYLDAFRKGEVVDFDPE